MCKAPIFGSTMFSCIRPESVWYNSISPYVSFEMYIMGYVFIEKLAGWGQWPVLWGTYKCFTLVDEALILASAKDLQCAWASKKPHTQLGCVCVVCGVTLENCLPVPRGALAKSKVGETLAWRHHHDLIFFQLSMYIQNVVIVWICLTSAALCISFKKKGSIKDSTEWGWDKVASSVYILHETTPLPP